PVGICTCRPSSLLGDPMTAETLEQARTWDRVKTAYLRDGFCDPCAAQAAWGHQNGFTRVRPICGLCVGTIPTYRHAGERARTWAKMPSHCSADEELSTSPPIRGGNAQLL